MRPIYKLDFLPDPKEDPDLWKFIDDPNLPRLINAVMLNEVRKYQPETLNNEQCRTQLARLKAFQEIIDLPLALKNIGEKTDIPSDIPPELEDR